MSLAVEALEPSNLSYPKGKPLASSSSMRNMTRSNSIPLTSLVGVEWALVCDICSEWRNLVKREFEKLHESPGPVADRIRKFGIGRNARWHLHRSQSYRQNFRKDEEVC